MMRKNEICKMKLLSLFIVLILTTNSFAQVTKVGSDTLYDFAGWNVEWLGNTSNGPTNETLQYNNVKTVLTNTDMDVWGLAEVCDATLFSNLLTDIPTYSGTLSTFSQTQKTALLWKKNMFTLISYANINDASQSDFYNAFAGRYPLEVVLATKDSLTKDTLYFYTIHLKANSGSADQASYDRRKNAADYLKTWLEKNRAGKKILVLGDWNDDVDQSVVKIGNYLVTPFEQFKSDTAKYFFPSLRLSLNNETSYPNYNPPNMIDHQMTSRQLSDSFYVKNSSGVMKQLKTQISSFLNNTSDHYPVYAQYNLKRYTKPENNDTIIPIDTTHTGTNSFEAVSNLSVYPNPTVGKLYLMNLPNDIEKIQLTSIIGDVVEIITVEPNTNIIQIPERLANGIYMLTCKTKNKSYRNRIALNR